MYVNGLWGVVGNFLLLSLSNADYLHQTYTVWEKLCLHYGVYEKLVDRRNCNRWPPFPSLKWTILTSAQLFLASWLLKQVLAELVFLLDKWISLFHPRKSRLSDSLVFEKIKQMSNLLCSLKRMPSIFMSTFCLWGIFSSLLICHMFSCVFLSLDWTSLYCLPWAIELPEIQLHVLNILIPSCTQTEKPNSSG